jgi:hypothetical protein
MDFVQDYIRRLFTHNLPHLAYVLDAQQSRNTFRHLIEVKKLSRCGPLSYQDPCQSSQPICQTIKCIVGLFTMGAFSKPQQTVGWQSCTYMHANTEHLTSGSKAVERCLCASLLQAIKCKPTVSNHGAAWSLQHSSCPSCCLADVLPAAAGPSRLPSRQDPLSLQTQGRSLHASQEIRVRGGIHV